MNEKMLFRAFYLSKMTVIEENESGNFEYTHLRYVEFLEFIGRISWFRYKDTHWHEQWTLAGKIKRLLKTLMAAVGE